jgi:DNA-binding Lrp family transcriptional regulator
MHKLVFLEFLRKLSRKGIFSGFRMIVIEYALLGNLYSYTIVAVIDLNVDKGRIRECPHCLEYGFH